MFWCDISTEVKAPHRRGNWNPFGVVFLVLWSLLSPSFGVPWLMQELDTESDRGRFPAVAIDTYGRVHVAYEDYARGRIKSCHWTGNTWQTTVVCESGKSPSVAIDSRNVPHIAYWIRNASEGSSHVGYASWNGTSWSNEIVGSGGADLAVSLVLDGNDRPHIAYVSAGDLIHAVWDGSGWIRSIVDATDTVRDLSLALDKAGRPRISYRRGPQNGVAGLYFSAWNGTAWEQSVVDRNGETGYANRLAIDRSGTPHIAYISGSSREVRYAIWSGSAWTLENISPDDEVMPSFLTTVSLAIDGEERPHIVYNETTSGSLFKHARKSSGGWVVEQIKYLGEYGKSCALAFDRTGKPHAAAYYSNSADEGKLFYFTSSPEWNLSTVDSDGSVGALPSIAVDSLRQPRIAYIEKASNLKYAEREGGEWKSSFVDSSGKVLYRRLSLQLTDDDKSRISYTMRGSDQNSYRIGYATVSGSSWNIAQIVPHSGFNGSETSLALTDSGAPFISYSVGTVGVFVTKRPGSIWQTEQVASLYSPGGSAIALNDLDQPRVSYFDRNAYTLMSAATTTTGWSTGTVAEFYASSGETAIAVDSAGARHIGFAGSRGAYYAWEAGGSWVVEPINTSGASGPVSLQFDSSWRPHMAFFNNWSYELVYAFSNGSRWAQVPFDRTRGDGKQIALAVDTLGLPHIAFYDPSTLDLRYGTTEASYDVWRARHFEADESHSAPLDDKDGDGCNNLLEYAFDTDPRFASRKRLPWTRVLPDTKRLAVQIPYDPGKTDLILEIQFSSDLQVWTMAARIDRGRAPEKIGAFTLTTIGSGIYKIVTVEDSLSSDSTTTRFARVKVTQSSQR